MKAGEQGVGVAAFRKDLNILGASHAAVLGSPTALPPPSLLRSIPGTGVADLSMNYFMFLFLPSGNITL